MSTPKKQKPVTAEELMARLQRDPVHQARMQDAERQVQENVLRYKAAAAPLIEDLSTSPLKKGNSL
jgi:hypothetical protein